MLTTAAILAESCEVARTREQSMQPWCDRPLVLHGAGELGRKILRGLRAIGVSPVAFVDADPRKHETSVDGVRIVSPAFAVREWAGEGVFVVAVFRNDADGGVAARVERWRRAGCARVMSYLQLAWQLPGVLPHYGAEKPSHLLAHADELRRMDTWWCDRRSRETFREQLLWRMHAQFPTSPPAADQYFPPDLFRLRADECLVDGGAFDGDTLRVAKGSLARAWAFEPDPSSVGRLRALEDPRVEIFELALGERAGNTRFAARGNWTSHRDEQGSLQVRVAALDDVLADAPVSFVKLDIEGDEVPALLGAQRMLRRCQPIVAACVYHRPEHLWEIPCLLNQLLPSHRSALRCHGTDGFELVFYAIPPSRWCGGEGE